MVPSFVKALEKTSASNLNYKRLVIIQLSGGNDGLNTIIPYTNDFYFKARPSLSIKKNNLKIDDDLAFHFSLTPLKRLYDQGYLSIINNVGYPNPNRSHFRSTDIWHTASDENEYLQSGWIGRYLDKYCKNPYNAIEVNESLSNLTKGNRLSGIAASDYRVLYKASKHPLFKQILKQNSDQHLHEHNLGYLYKMMISAKSSANYIYENTKISLSGPQYPNHQFGKQLKTIAEFINSGLNTKVFYASLDGFDTHVNQITIQKRLLENYANTINTFVNDLKSNNTFKDTLILTFSEFGRRLNQNAANGTDHGAANNVFVIGENLKKQGVYNKLTSLEDLDQNGDIKYEIDFRNIYATILRNWFDVDEKTILKKEYDRLDFI